MSNYSVTAYLLLVIVFDVLGVSISLYLWAKHAQRTFSHLRLLRNGIDLAGSLLTLFMFRLGLIGNWTALIAVAALHLLVFYAYAGMIKRRAGLRVQSPSSDVSALKTGRERWEKVRAKGKRRYILVNATFYGGGMLWLMFLSKIVLGPDLPLYLLMTIVGAGAIAGATSAISRWNWSEKKYSAVNGSNDRAA